MPYYPPVGDAVVVLLPDIVVSQNAVIAINAGTRNITVACAGTIVGERMQLNPVSHADGYAIGQAFCATVNTITVPVTAPLLTIGASFAITCKVYALR